MRDRHSYAFALVSVAAGLEIADGVIRSAASRWAVSPPSRGGSPTPKRHSSAGLPDVEAFRAAARTVMAGAEPLSQNEFKIDLGRHSVVRALTWPPRTPRGC